MRRETEEQVLAQHAVDCCVHQIRIPPLNGKKAEPRYSRSVFMSWLLPCCRSAPPLAMGWRLGEVWLSGRGASCSPSLLLSSPLPEALAESEELLLPLLLICSITSTSARSSANSGGMNVQTPVCFILHPSPISTDPFIKIFVNRHHM